MAKIKKQKDGTFHVTGVPVFATGTYQAGNMPKPRTFTEKDLDRIAENYEALRDNIDPPVKLDHVADLEEGGPPRLGTVARVYRVGKVLFADLIDIPKKLADAIKRRNYKRVSIELRKSFTDQAKRKFKDVLHAVTLLGTKIPAVNTLEGLAGLYDTTPDDIVFVFEDDGVEIEAYGLLADEVRKAELERMANQLTWKAESLISRILRGRDEFEGLTPDERKAKIAEVVTELNVELQKLVTQFVDDDGVDGDDELSGEDPPGDEPNDAGSDESEAGSTGDSEDDGSGDETPDEGDSEMSDKPQGPTAEEFAALKAEKEALEVKNRQTETARIKGEVKAAFDTLEKDEKLLPFERAIAEPMATFLMGSDAGIHDENETYSREVDGKPTTLAADFIGLFEARGPIAKELIESMSGHDGDEKGKTETFANVSLELDSRARKHMADNENVEYSDAVHAVLETDADLDKRYTAFIEDNTGFGSGGGDDAE